MVGDRLLVFGGQGPGGVILGDLWALKIENNSRESLEAKPGNIQTTAGNIQAKPGNIQQSPEADMSSPPSEPIETKTGNMQTTTGNIQTKPGNNETQLGSIETRSGNIETQPGNIEPTTGNLGTDTGNIETNTGNLETSIGNVEPKTGNVEPTTGNLEISGSWSRLQVDSRLLPPLSGCAVSLFGSAVFYTGGHSKHVGWINRQDLYRKDVVILQRDTVSVSPSNTAMQRELCIWRCSGRLV
jgi:hypothetical protein